MLSKRQDRIQTVQIIKQAAQLYKTQLVGKTFLYVFDGRYIEVIYKTANFRHLTGVDSTLSANAFFKDAVSGKLQERQIFFSPRHPYALAQKKLAHIQQLAQLAGTESLMLEEIVTSTKTYKFGTTDLCFSLCFNQELDSSGNPKGSCYVAESLRDEDCFSKSKNVFAVTHIFCKSNDQPKYDTLLYHDGSTPLPLEVQEMLQPGLCHDNPRA